jgi:GMP synthase-like glutamine amidotransferase
VLLGGGPWGSAGGRNVPTLIEELTLTKAALQKGLPVLGIGLGAQLLSIMAGGSVEPTDLRFEVGEATRVDAAALDGFLPERYPLVIYGRDRPLPPPEARILAVDSGGHPALFQVGANALGFTGHPGIKAAIIEDLIMEFEEAPADPGPTLARLRETQAALEDALVPIMTGVVRVLRLMD